jgi:hypothetical protein
VLKSQGISLKSSGKIEETLKNQNVILQKRFQGLSRTFLKGQNLENSLKQLQNRANTNDPQFVSAKLNKDQIEDPFFYGNLKKTSNFSPFRLLFEENIEQNSISYPYFSKNIKNLTRMKTLPKVSLKTKLKRLQTGPHCKCLSFLKISSTQATFEEIRESLPFLREVKRVVKTLYRIFFFPQKAQSFKNIIIVYLEGTFATCKPVKLKKKGTWKTLRKLSTFFQIVIVVQEKRLKDWLLTVIESKKMQVSGLYFINEHSGVTFRCSKFLDYSQIYYDFEISNPQSNCLVITCHGLDEVSSDPEEIIFDQARPWTHLTVSGVPVASYEYYETPYLIIIPQLRKENNCEILKKFLNDLEELFVEFKSFRDTLSFPKFFERFSYPEFKTIRAHHHFLDLLDGHLLDKEIKKEGNRVVIHCALHKRYYKYFKLSRPTTTFIIL